MMEFNDKRKDINISLDKLLRDKLHRGLARDLPRGLFEALVDRDLYDSLFDNLGRNVEKGLL